MNIVMNTLYSQQQCAPIVTSDFEAVQMVMKVELKSATTMHGALCVTTSGILMMPMWPADSWDSIQPVNAIIQHFNLHEVH